MFRVEADNLSEYFSFDRGRESDLKDLDRLIARSAPGLKRYFHRGTPEGEPGMRFRMIGYGKHHYSAKNGKLVEWPALGVALQKNYISVYLAIQKDKIPLVQFYAGKLGELKIGRNNFSFRKFADLDARGASTLFAEADSLFKSGAWR